MRPNRLVAIINRDDRCQQSLAFLFHFLPILLSQKLGPIVKKHQEPETGLSMLSSLCYYICHLQYIKDMKHWSWN